MSLGQCRVCGHAVSSLAEVCVNCGRSTRRHATPAGRHGHERLDEQRDTRSIQCFECGHPVSVLAVQCHNCGSTLQAQLTPASPFLDEHKPPRRGRRASILRPGLLRA